MSSEQKIQQLEKEIYELSLELGKLKKNSEGKEVRDYTFTDLNGQVRLSELFGVHNKLLLIHNMGQGCRYCTLWGDGINGMLAHLESAMSVVLVSKDSPQVQRQFANSRGWRFRLASHTGGEYIREQTVMNEAENMPGAVVYEKQGSKMFRKNAAVFGPGDLYCSTWHLLSLAGLGPDSWTPQFNYWQRPVTLDDGGENLLG